MRKEYDFSKLKTRRNPYAKKLKASEKGEGSIMKTLLDAPSLSTNERLAITEAARVLKRELPVTRVILFGSKARGDSRPDSDIDLLVLTSEPPTRAIHEATSSRLFEIELRYDVLLSNIIVSEAEWRDGLIHHMLIYKEVQRDGCEI